MPSIDYKLPIDPDPTSTITFHQAIYQLPQDIFVGDSAVAALEVKLEELDCEDVDEFRVDPEWVSDASAGVGKTFALPSLVQNAVAIARLDWAATCVWAWT